MAGMCYLRGMPNPTQNVVDQTIAANVKAETARAQVTQSDVAKALGLSRTSLGDRLAGRISFLARELVVLANLFEVHLSVLTDGATVAHRVAQLEAEYQAAQS